MSVRKEFNLETFLRNALRRAFSRTPYYRLAREKVKKVTYVGKRKRVFFQCETCGEWFPRSETHVHHVVPVIDPATGFIDWNTFVARLFTDNLTVECLECHKRHTAEGAKHAAERRRKEKTSAA